MRNESYQKLQTILICMKRLRIYSIKYILVHIDRVEECRYLLTKCRYLSCKFFHYKNILQHISHFLEWRKAKKGGTFIRTVKQCAHIVGEILTIFTGIRQVYLDFLIYIRTHAHTTTHIYKINKYVFVSVCTLASLFFLIEN